MIAERDPRIKPKEGDILRLADGSQVKVYVIDGGVIYAEMTDNPSTSQYVTFSLWKVRAKDAQIIRYGDEEETEDQECQGCGQAPNNCVCAEYWKDEEQE